MVAQSGGNIEAFWVQGLGYTTTAGVVGRTTIGMYGDHAYLFRYGDSVVFNFGNLRLPEVPAQAQTTPFAIFRTRNQHSNQIRNLMRLMLTVSVRPPILGNPTSHYDLATPAVPESYSSTTKQVFVTLDDLALSPSQFEASAHVAQFLADAGRPQLAPLDVSNEFWLESVRESVMNVDRDSWTNRNDDDDDNDGVPDLQDAFPWDADESVDDDGNGVGDAGNTQYFPLPFAPYRGDSGSLPISLHDTAYDDSTGRLYVTNQADKSLTAFDIQTGAVLGKLTFDYETTKLVLDAPRNRLILALQTQSPSSYTPPSLEKGYVVIVDLATFTKTRQFEIGLDPFDVVVTADGYPVVSSASGQWTRMDLYDDATGALLSSANIYMTAHLAYDPQRQWLFAKPLTGSIQKFEVHGTQLVDTNIFSDSAPPVGSVVAGPEGEIWLTPDGRGLFTTNGMYYSAEQLRYQTNVPSWIYGIDFHPGDDMMYLVDETNRLRRYQLSSLTETGSVAYNLPISFRTLIWGQKLAEVRERGGFLHIVLTEADGQMTLIRKPSNTIAN